MKFDNTKIVEREYVKQGTFEDDRGYVYTDLPCVLSIFVEKWAGVFLEIGNGEMDGLIVYSALAKYMNERV